MIHSKKAVKKKAKYTSIMPGLVVNRSVPRKSKKKIVTVSEAANELLMMNNINHMMKAFPNLDPDFFKSPRVRAAESEAIDKPYQKSVWVYAACQAIATNLLQVPKGLDLKSTEEKEFIEDHPLLKLMDNPNPLMDGMAFWEAIILALLLPTSTTPGGQCFIIADSGTNKIVDLSRGQIPKELWPFDDSNIDPIKDKNNLLLGWRMTVGANSIDYLPEEVIRIRLFNPYDLFRGQSPLIAATSGLLTTAKAQKVNETFFENNATLGGVLETDQNPDQDEVKRIRKKFNELYSGPENAGKVAVLSHGLKYQQFMRTHIEMQYIEQLKFNRDEILAVYRVPKSEVTIYEDLNFATASVADKGFWTKTVIPYDKRILKSINDQWICNVENGKYRLRSDYSNVEALQVNFKEKLDNAASLVKMNVPLKEVNRRLELNLDIEQYEWLKTALVNFNLTTAENILEDADEPPDTGSDHEDDEKGMTQEQRDFQSEYWKNVVSPGIRSFRKKMGAFLLAQLLRNLKLVDKWAETALPGNYPNPEDLILEALPENELLHEKQRQEYQKSIVRERERMEVELDEKIVPVSELSGKPDTKIIGWDQDAPGIQDSLQGRLNSLDGVNKFTFSRVLGKVKTIIGKAITDRETVQRTAKLLRDGIGDIYKSMTKGEQRNRINTIARTEMGIIHSDTRFSIMQAAGIKKIEWLDSKDTLVRDGKGGGFSHRPKAFKSTKVLLGKPFNNGELIRYPRDTRASAANVINCRCTFRAVKPKD